MGQSQSLLEKSNSQKSETNVQVECLIAYNINESDWVQRREECLKEASEAHPSNSHYHTSENSTAFSEQFIGEREEDVDVLLDTGSGNNTAVLDDETSSEDSDRSLASQGIIYVEI